MHGKAINLDHLEIVLGRPPRRYAKGDLRNTRRARWIQRAAIATAALLARNDARGERTAAERKARTNGKPGLTAIVIDRTRTDYGFRPNTAKGGKR